ncbi:MAG TPA: hypothetical protein VGC14_02060 [Rhizobium sp.]
MGVIRDKANVVYANGPSEYPFNPPKDGLRDLMATIEDLISGAAEGSVSAASWSDLSANPGERVGQPGTVASTDTGTHADPVTGSTVNNAGSYAWSASPAGWKRVGDIIDAANVTAMIKSDAALGGAFERATENGQWLAGATVRLDAKGRRMGWTIPAGSTGQNSYVRPIIEIPSAIRARLAGRTVTVAAQLSMSDGYVNPITAVIQVVLVDGTVSDLTTTVINTQVDSSHRVILFSAALPANVRRLQPYLRQSSAATTGAERWVMLDDLQFRISQSTALIGGPNADLNTWTAETEAARRASDASAGRLIDDATLLPQVFNGATVRKDAAGRSAGWTIPTDQTGVSSLMQVILPLDRRTRRALAGQRVRFSMSLSTSDSYSKNIGVVGQVVPVAGGTRAPTVEVINNIPIGTTGRLIEFEFDIVGDETALQPYIQSTTGGAAAADMWVLLTTCDVRIVTDGVRQKDTLLWALGNTQRIAAEKTISLTDPHYVYPIMVTVAPSGGDYTKPSLADAAILDASVIDKAQITIEHGTYTETNWAAGANKVWRGRDRDDTILQLLQSDDAALTDISTNSVVFGNYSGEWRNLTFIVKNGRYAFHCDSGTAVKNNLEDFENCYFLHLGNDGAVAYQASISGNPNGVWASTHAFAIGSSSGTRVRFKQCTFDGVRAGLQFHTNGGHTNPAEVTVDQCRLIARNALPNAYALILQPLGSLQDDLCRVTGSQLEGDIQYFADPWLQTSLANQPADHCEIRLEGYGNSPAVFLNQEWGRALRIDDASTADGSGIAVSGDAVSVLFGQQAYTVPGAGGTSGYLYGWADVSGTGVGSSRNVFITSLGQRLGDCSTTSKTLVVTPAGGSAVTVAFNQDFTAQSNATVLAFINAALGSAAVASLYNVGGRYRPFFRDEERTLQNTSATTILMGMVLAYDGDNRSVRPMISGDNAPYAGVAWEDIYPTKFGRVKTSGYLPIADVLRTDSDAISFGDTFSIDAAKPGYVVKGGTQGLLKAIRNNALRVG